MSPHAQSTPYAQSTPHSAPTRRSILRGTAAGGLALLGAGLAPSVASAVVRGSAFGSTGEQPDPDYTDPAFYDWIEAYYHETTHQQPDSTNESGEYAWGQAYALRSYLQMYRAFGDRKYLDYFVRNVDQMLANRDSERGVTDYRGLSLPAWRAGYPYTAGSVDLHSEDGRPVLRLRTAHSYADDVTVTVSHGDAAGTFSVDVVRNGQTTSFHEVTMDRSSESYAVERIFASAPNAAGITAVDLRSGGEGPDRPAQVTDNFASGFYLFAVHTGMITAPIAEFVRIVRADPRLAPGYRATAAHYRRAVVDAVAVHESEYRENAAGEGWYIIERGAPVGYDGVDLPHNQYLALATTHIHLSTMMRPRHHRARAAALLTTFGNDLRRSGDAWVWNYYWSQGHMGQGWTAEDDLSDHNPVFGGSQGIEDTSHGAVDIEAAVVAHRAGLVFDEADMRRFAATFTGLMLTEHEGVPSVYRFVDGTGSPGAVDLQAPRWLPLAHWDSGVYTGARDVFENDEPNFSLGSNVLGAGWLIAESTRHR